MPTPQPATSPESPSDGDSLMFVGDLACPAGLTPRIEGELAPAMRGVVVNLEGAIRPATQLAAAVKVSPRLYNRADVTDVLRTWDTRLACLANNHIMDLGLPPSHTIEQLARAGIASVGAGDTLAQAARPAVIQLDDREVVFLAFGWSTIQCRPAGPHRPGVNPLHPEHVLRSTREARQAHPAAKLVLLMHWDYELERYPMPMHRQLAFEAIDAGADLIVGHHPHCVQGMEVHRGVPIIYSLGNWFFPHGKWFGPLVRFPAYTNEELAFEWRPTTCQGICHWFEYDPSTHAVMHRCSEPADESKRMQELTPFRGMSHRDYATWFRQHRFKRKALPIYTDFHRHRTNALFDHWVAWRHRIIKLLLMTKIKRRAQGGGGH